MNEQALGAERVPLPDLTDVLRRPRGCNKTWTDSRRFPRIHANVACQAAPESTYRWAGHESQPQDVWLREMSRGGASFFHGAQFFPGERCTLCLPTGVCLHLEVIWCRRVAEGTFLSGCRFVKGDAEAPPASDLASAK
jgi:hypothetical protein